jgi:uncharacterized protein YjbJ (UPF0337 family)
MGSDHRVWQGVHWWSCRLRGIFALPSFISPFPLWYYAPKRNILTSDQSLKQQGREQNASGKAQEAQGQLNDFGSGVANRVSGAVSGAVAGITGDREAQVNAQQQHDAGKTQQRGAEYDIQKQNQ